MSTRTRFARALLFVAPVVLLLAGVFAWLFIAQGGFLPYAVPRGEPASSRADERIVAQGAYLARLGNCAACHTRRGGEAYAGGRAFVTPYGRVFSTNITPDRETGIGDWSLAEFRHAMRHGVSRHGPLYPVFPYANFARLTDADLDALHAYLRSLPPLRAPRVENELAFPANIRRSLVLWRMRYERPARRAAPVDDALARGRDLVEGLGHCSMCHGARDSRGALSNAVSLGGATIPGLGWYAPPLNAESLSRYDEATLATYLQTGTSMHGDAYGPMAEVVFRSLQYLTDADARAMAAYLLQAPGDGMAERRTPRAPAVAAAPARQDARAGGRTLYETHCTDCHGSDGRGEAGRYPALRDSVAATAPTAANAIRLVLYGGVPPVTRGNPLPYSMPPFSHQLTREEVAQVVEYLRAEFGGRPERVTADDVDRLGGIAID